MTENITLDELKDLIAAVSVDRDSDELTEVKILSETGQTFNVVSLKSDDATGNVVLLLRAKDGLQK